VKRARTWQGLALAALCLLVVAGVASSARALGRPVVEVFVAGPAEDAESLEASLRELLLRLGLDMRAVTVDDLDSAAAAPPAEDVLVRARVDLRSPDVALVVLSDPTGRRPDLRRFVPRRDSPSVFLEEVAHVAQAGTESLLSGEPASPPSAAPSQPSPPSPPPAEKPLAGEPARPSSRRFDLATFATASSLARDAGVVFGVGLAGRLELGRGPGRPALWVLGAYHFPFGSGSFPVEVHASMWSLRFLPSISLLETGRVGVEAGAGAGADFFVLTHGIASPDVAVDADRTDVSPILSAMVAARVEIAGSTSALLAATLDWDLTPREYLFASNAGTTSLVRPFPLRPGLSLGLAFDVAGTPGVR
jgi:hypothetical protein